MAFVLADRVRETTTTAGTGAVSLAGAVSGFQTFSAAIGNANNTYYTIADPITGAWEVGIGTYTSSGNTLSRDTVLSSSNSGSLVTFAANSKDVFVTQPASRAVFVQNAGTGLQTGTTAFTANRVIYSDATSTTATSASLTFDGTTLTSAAFSGPLNGTVGATTPNTGAFTSVVSTSASGILTRTAATQDGVALVGRAGGTSSYEVTLTPTTLTADRTLTLPDISGTLLVDGGPLGTPSSGTVTNLTGTASININGTVGATTPNTGAFTSVTAVSASGIQTRAAATQDGIHLIGRAGGTSNWEVTLTPTTLTADRTLTLPDATTTVAGTDATQTLTNKRVTPRVSTTTSSATPTINTDTTDVFGLTAQTVDITSFTTNLSGTPTDGQLLRIYIVGTAARAITWGASFESSTVTLPGSTVSTNRLDVGFVWNAATSKWRCVATA